MLCQPGTCDAAKSMPTMLCTLITSGAASPASSRYIIWYRCQCRALFLQPIESMPYTTRPMRWCERSRSVAKSGISPTYQNSSDTSEYVLTAKTSQISGLRNCGQSSIELG